MVGFIKDDVGDLTFFRPDLNEVDRVFTRSLSELLAPESRSRHSYKHQGVTYTLPEWGEKDDNERIWGLTACVLEAVLDQLFVPFINKRVTT